MGQFGPSRMMIGTTRSLETVSRTLFLSREAVSPETASTTFEISGAYCPSCLHIVALLKSIFVCTETTMSTSIGRRIMFMHQTKTDTHAAPKSLEVTIYFEKSSNNLYLNFSTTCTQVASTRKPNCQKFYFSFLR